jgi:transposase
LLQSFGHSVKLIAPQLVKPYIKRGKNDAADAEALCDAMSRPTIASSQNISRALGITQHSSP